MKLKNSEDIVNFTRCLANKNKKEDQKDSFDLDDMVKLKMDEHQRKKSEEYEFYMKESEKFTDENLKNCRSVLTQMMPRYGHTIYVNDSDICLTVTMKNTGEIAWPKGFRIWSDQGKIMYQNP